MIYVLLVIIIAGVAYTIYRLISMDSRSYHVEPYKGLVDDKLFGGTGALENLPLRVPLLYLQRRREGSTTEFYLNVLIPLPPEHFVVKTTESLDTTNRILSIHYETTSDNSGDPGKRLFHETLIPVGPDVSKVEVFCDPNNQSPGSGIGTGDSDSADPVNGGAATPYMSSNVSGPCTMVYNGGDDTIEARVTALSGASVATTIGGDVYIGRTVQPAGVVASVSVGDRMVEKVYAP